MGDLIASVFGGGGQTTEQREVDPLTKQMNQMRYNQVAAMLGYPGYDNWMIQQYAQPNAAYTASPQTQQLYNAAAAPLLAGPSMTLQDYQNLGLGTAGQNLTNSLNLQNAALAASRGQNYANLASGTGALGDILASQEGTLGNVLNLQQSGLGNIYNAQKGDIQGYLGQGQGILNDVLARQQGDLRSYLGEGQNLLNNVLGTQQGNLRSFLGEGQGLLNALASNQQAQQATALGQQVGAIQGAVNTQRDLNAQGLTRASDLSKTSYGDLFNQIKSLGLDQTSNYINQIARPQIQQQMALQGLEGGGAVDAAIAKATAEYGMPVVQMLASLAGQQQGIQGQLGSQYLGGEQNIGQQYGSNIAQAYGQNTQNIASILSQLTAGQQNLFGQYGQGLEAALQQYGAGQQNLYGQYGQGLQSALAQYGQGNQGLLSNVGNLLNTAMGQYGAGNQAMLQQYGGNIASALSQYGGNVANLISGYNAGDLNLLGNYASALGNLSGQYNQGTLNFIGSLPGAQQTLQITPAQTAAALFPMADYQGQLNREDLMRRQGLIGTALTGLPYTPGGTVTQEKVTPSLFSNITGIGSNQGFFGKGTGIF